MKDKKELPKKDKKKTKRKIWEILSTSADVIQMVQFFDTVVKPVIAKTAVTAVLAGVTAGATIVAGNTIVHEIRYQGQTGAQGVQGLSGQNGVIGEKGDKGDTGIAGINGLNGVSGWERLNAISPSNSNYRKDVFVSCTGNKKVIGGGANIRDGDDRRTYIMQSFPDTDHSWRAGASVSQGTYDVSAINWSLEVFIICADIF